MSLNYSTLPMLLDEKVRTVRVKFFSDGSDRLGSKNYVYLTTHEFEKGDLGVVIVSNVPKIVVAQEMDAPTTDDIQYKWIVDKVDTESFEANMETCQNLAKTIRKMEQDNQRKQIMDALGVKDNKEFKALSFK